MLCQRRRLLSVHINADTQADWHRDDGYLYWKGTRFEFQQRTCYNYFNFNYCPEFVRMNVKIFIFPLFNDALSIWNYLASNGMPTNKYELEIIWNEASMYWVSILQFAWRDSRKPTKNFSCTTIELRNLHLPGEVRKYYKLIKFSRWYKKRHFLPYPFRYTVFSRPKKYKQHHKSVYSRS
jgi:hypothetical protein